MDKTLESHARIATLMGSAARDKTVVAPDYVVEVNAEHPRKRRNINRWRVSRLRRLMVDKQRGWVTLRQQRRIEHLQYVLHKARIGLGELGV